MALKGISWVTEAWQETETAWLHLYEAQGLGTVISGDRIQDDGWALELTRMDQEETWGVGKFCVLMWVIAAQMYTYIKTHWSVHVIAYNYISDKQIRSGDLERERCPRSVNQWVQPETLSVVFKANTEHVTLSKVTGS